MCTIRYVIPYLNKCVGYVPSIHRIALASDYSFGPKLTYFLQVKTQYNDYIEWAIPVTGKGSGDLANLVDADGFLELPAEKSYFKKGEIYNYYPYRL